MNGVQWTPDQYFTGGDVYYQSNFNPDTRLLYGTARYGLYGNFSYSIPRDAGDYTVNLYFAELQVGKPDLRVFDVAINGTVVLNDYDILKQTPALTMVKKTFAAKSVNGRINITFTGVKRFGTISAIEILPAAAPAPTIDVTPTTSTVAPGQSVQLAATVQNSTNTAVTWQVFPSTAGSVTSTGKFTSSLSISQVTACKVRATLQSNTAITDEATVTVAPGGGSAPTTSVIRINSGIQEAFKDPNGNTWIPDKYFAGGEVYTNMTLPTDVRRLLGTARQGLWSGFSYRIPVPPGQYKVALNFVELMLTVPDHRVFHVKINGQQVLTNFDILKQALPLKTLQKVFTVDAASGLVEIEFIGVKRQGTVSAVEIVPATSSVSAPLNASGTPSPDPDPDPDPDPVAPTLLSSPTSLSFSMVEGSGNPAAKSVSVSTNPSGSKAWTAQSLNTGLISVTPGSGNTPGSFNVSIVGSGRAAGSYNGTVRVTATGVTGSPIDIPVSLSVAPQSTTPPPPTGDGNQFFVSPTGTSGGNGSIGSPWSLQTALNHPAAVKPGDTIWVRGGVYKGKFRAQLKGTAADPIIVRNYNDERATIDTGIGAGGAGIEVYGQDTWYWGLEIMSSNPNRITGTTGSSGSANLGLVDGVDTFGLRNKFINLIIHDTRQGYGFWEYGIDNEIYGNLLYYNGWAGGDRGHGHAIYSQNRTGIKVVENNIQFKGYAMGIRAIGSGEAAAKGYRFRNNISFESGALWGNKWTNFAVAVGSGAEDILVENTYTYHDTSKNDGESWLGWTGAGIQKDVIARGNYWIGGENAIDVKWWNDVTYENNVSLTTTGAQVWLETKTTQPTSRYIWRNNRYYGVDRFRWQSTNYTFANWKAKTGMEAGSTFTTARPPGVEAFVLPNKYEPGRAHIAVYNWTLQNTVQVNVGSVLKVGDSFEVKDSQNYYGPAVLTGVYNGQPLTLPMSLTAQAATSGPAKRPPVHTGKEFNAFVLIKK